MSFQNRFKKPRWFPTGSKMRPGMYRCYAGRLILYPLGTKLWIQCENCTEYCQ